MTSDDVNVKSVGFIPGPYRDEIFQWPIAKLRNVDVWKYLFDNYITNPADKMNLILASPQFFGPLLKEEKCSILFGQVAHILHKNNYLDVTNKELLEYRHLSKSCKLSLDKSLRTDTPCFVNLNGFNHDKNDPRHVCWTHQDENFPSIDYKMNCYKSSIENGSSPFINGSLQCGSGNNYSDFLPKIKLLLSTCGSQVYNFQFNLTSRRLDYGFSRSNDYDGYLFIEPRKYELLCNFLKMMPNVRTLELKEKGGAFTYKDVQIAYANFHPPDLNHLEVLKLKDLRPKAVRVLLQKYGPKLKKLSLEVSNVYYKEELKYARALSYASNLKELSLYRITDDMKLQRFFTRHVKCPLSLTSISISLELKPDSSRTFKVMTNVLAKMFGRNKKLHTLNISIFVEQYRNYGKIEWYDTPPDDMYFDLDSDEGKNEQHTKFISTWDRLKLPSLRRLWIHCDHVCFNSIDFILGVQNTLEELVLNLDNCVPERRRRVDQIQFVDYWHKMDESNVWKMMPNLQRITIRCGDQHENAECRFPNCYEYKRSTTVVST